MNDFGVLLIHGFHGTEQDLEPLAAALKERGMEVYAMRLAGHGESDEHFFASRAEDWIASADRAVQEMTQKFSRVAVVGFSMGGLLALKEAAQHTLAAVVTVNTPLFYGNFAQKLRNFCGRIRGEYRRTREGRRTPLRVYHQFFRVLRRVKPLLRHVHCPVQINQVKNDHVVRLKSVRYLTKKVAGAVTVHWYEKGRHKVMLSKYKEPVVQNAAEFLEQVRSQGQEFLA